MLRRQVVIDFLILTYTECLYSAFFESIKGVGTCVGARSLEEYILPLMVQALTGMVSVVDKVARRN